jgi:hypothetical protein
MYDQNEEALNVKLRGTYGYRWDLKFKRLQHKSCYA